MATGLLTTPFDVWKIRSQVHVGSQVTVSQLVRQEGVLSLWRGLRPTMIMSLPSSGAYFTIYEYLKMRLQNEHGADMAAPLLAGSAARVISAIAVCPLEIARTNFQAISRPSTSPSPSLSSSRLSASRLLPPPSPTSTLGLLLASVRQRGVLSLWTGLGPTILRDVPFSAIYWGLYEVLRRDLEARFQLPTGDVRVAFVCGAASGLVAAAATNPLDVVKSRRQAQILATQETGTAMQITRRIWLQEGWTGFLAGVAPRCAKVAPACAIMISTYEGLKSLLAAAP